MDAGRSPAVFRCLRFRERNRRIRCLPGLTRPPMHHIWVTGRDGVTSGVPAALGNRSRRGEQPFVLALGARGKGIERAAPQGAERADYREFANEVLSPSTRN
jgi:hypothetical protein